MRKVEIYGKGGKFYGVVQIDEDTGLIVSGSDHFHPKERTRRTCAHCGQDFMGHGTMKYCTCKCRIGASARRQGLRRRGLK